MSNTNVKEAMSDKKMSLTDHLAELRTCLMVSVIAIVAGFFISFYFSYHSLYIKNYCFIVLLQ